MGAFESCEEEEAGEEEGAANEGASSDEGEPPGGRSQHLHAIASHPQREQRVTESSGSEKVLRLAASLACPFAVAAAPGARVATSAICRPFSAKLWGGAGAAGVRWQARTQRKLCASATHVANVRRPRRAGICRLLKGDASREGVLLPPEDEQAVQGRGPRSSECAGS